MTQLIWNSPTSQVAIQEIDGKPGVAKCTKGALLVYSRNNNLYYRMGAQEEKDYPVIWRKEARYGTGIAPAVSVTEDGSIVEIHQSEHRNVLFYTVGLANFSSGSIEWQSAQQTDDGVAPLGIALSASGSVVEVHKSQTYDKLWYHMGTLAGNEVNWAKSSVEYTSGVTPSVALAALSSGLQAIEVHKSQSYDKLWYLAGQVDVTSGKIALSQSTEYQSGVQPSVAVNANGSVVEVHKSQSHDKLYCLLGTLSRDKLDWPTGGTPFADGSQPTVAIDSSGQVLVVYVDSTDTSEVNAITGYLQP